MGLQNLIDDFVADQLKDVKIERVREKKLIRDALTGSMVLEKHEVNLIDLPLIQRLRRIHQTSLAFYTYPCCTHNRFQHTLGVLNIVTKLATSLSQKYPSLIDSNIIKELRVAAILHDIGFGLFSHASEEILEHFPAVRSELANNPKFSKAKVHEMFSYLIVTSNAFKEIIHEINVLNNTNIDINRVANMIVGKMDDPRREAYLSDLINGPFDADKLDYMPRDAYFSGLKMEVDLERIAYTSLIETTPDNYRRVCCDITGAHNLEQILFNKVLLYSSIYHHHKVRAAVCMFKSIFEIIQDKNIQINNLTFKQPIDFLSIDDDDMFSIFVLEPALADEIKDLRNRKLLKRALIISRDMVKEPEYLQKLERLGGSPDILKDLRMSIVDEMSKRGIKCSVYDLWIDIPQPPYLPEPSQCFIKVGENKYVTLNRIFPAEWWLSAYEQAKRRIYIFSPPQTQIRDVAADASQKVLQDQLGIECTPDAKISAKIS